MIPTRSLPAALVLSFLVPATAAAQTVLVRVLDAESSMPLVGAIAYLEDAGGSTARNTLTDERGRALFVGVAAGAYRIRVEMIGMASTATELFDVSEGSTVTREIRMESSAIELEGIEVELEADR